MTPSRARVRLLYIDDDRALARRVEKDLARHDVEVVWAEHGDAGLELLRGEVFDTCALDHYMPLRDGLDVLPDILAQPEPPPVIYVTGAEDGRIAVSALRAGAADYVMKDVAEDFTALLRAAVGDAVARRRLELANARALEEVRQARDRAQALLREVNHRVGNSLQLVSSFMSLQQRQVADAGARSALRQAQARIEAVAHVHRRLYTSDDVTTVAMDEYLAGLVQELSRSVGAGDRGVSVSLQAEPMRVPTDQAVSLGVVVTELVTNAVKYAYPPGQSGEIRVLLQAGEAGRGMVTVEDDGAGMAGGVAKGSGLGGQIIAAMARDLGSAVEFDPSHRGVRARLVFPR